MVVFMQKVLNGFEWNGGKRSKGRPRLTFENTVSKILEEGHVQSMRTPRRACMKRLMTVDEAKEVCRDRTAFGAPFSPITPLGIKREVSSSSRIELYCNIAINF